MPITAALRDPCGLRVRAHFREVKKKHAPIATNRRSIIASVFRAAARQQPGMACPRARAMYGCDVMVTEDLEPRLLEVTFSPANLAASPAWPVRSEEGNQARREKSTENNTNMVVCNCR